MSMSLAELDAQDVTLLPERATLHGGFNFTVISIHQTAIANAGNFSLNFLSVNTAVAGIVNL
jgi:hypothetical protein